MFPTLIVQLPQPDILDAGCFISHHPVKWKQMAVIIKPIANKKDIAISPSVQRFWFVSWDETPSRSKNMNALLLLNRAFIPSGLGPPVYKSHAVPPKVPQWRSRRFVRIKNNKRKKCGYYNPAGYRRVVKPSIPRDSPDINIVVVKWSKMTASVLKWSRHLLFFSNPVLVRNPAVSRSLKAHHE